MKETMEKIEVKKSIADGVPEICGRMCSYETKKIRKFIHKMLSTNDSFNLPDGYYYEITAIHGFAKICHL